MSVSNIVKSIQDIMRKNEVFFEQRDHLFDLLRQINSQIQNNTEHLEHEADRLSKRLGSADFMTCVNFKMIASV